MKNSRQQKNDEIEILYAKDFHKLKYERVYLTKEQQYEYIKKCQLGDKGALEEFMELNQLLVLKYAQKIYEHNYFKTFELEDLIQEGNIGLMIAIKNFDLNSNFKFSTYAVKCIAGTIYDAIKVSDKTISIPCWIQSNLNKIKKLKITYFNKYNREISDEEIIKILKLNENQYELIKYAKDIDTISLISTNSDGEEKNNIEVYADNDILHSDVVLEEIFKSDRNDIILNLLQTLTEKQRDVITKYYGLTGIMPMTFEEIASLDNQSRQNIQQTEAYAIKKLTLNRKTEVLRDYYE